MEKWVQYDGKGGEKRLYKCGDIPRDDESGAEAIEDGADNPFTSSPEYMENDMGQPYNVIGQLF